MPLTTEEINRVVTDHLNGKKPSIHGEDADAIRKDVDETRKRAEKSDGFVDVPAEWSGSD